MRSAVGLSGAPRHAEKSADCDFDSASELEASKASARSHDSGPVKDMKDSWGVLQELQEEARELLSLTYGLRVDTEPAPTAGLDGFRVSPPPSGRKLLLESPRLNLDPETKLAVDARWAQDAAPKKCKLLPGTDPSRTAETEKLFSTKTSCDSQERQVANFTSMDTVAPVRHLEKGVAYPLDLSVGDLCRSTPLIASATREGYQEMLVSLQQKYSVVLRMFEEINEQRMSYIEGLHELQGHLDNARSVMQLQKAEIAKLHSEAGRHEAVAHQVSRDLERCNDALSQRVHHEAKLEAKVREQQATIDRLTAQAADMQASVDSLTERLSKISFMPKLSAPPEFCDVEYTYEQALRELQDFVKAMCTGDVSEASLDSLVSSLEQGAGPLRYLEAAFDCPLIQQLAEFYRQRFVIANRFKDEVLQIQEEKEKELERNYERTQQLIDTYAARVHQANAENLSTRSLLQTFARRATMCAPSIDSKSKMAERISQKLRTPFGVQLGERPLVGPFAFRPSFVCVADGSLQFGRHKGDKFVPKSVISLKDVHKVDFGFNSSAYILHNAAVRQPHVFPWHFFTIVTGKREYHVVCTENHLVDVLLIGLNLMIAPYRFMVTALDISHMRLLRAKSKLHYYCVKHGISHRRMWLMALRKTAAEQHLPVKRYYRHAECSGAPHVHDARLEHRRRVGLLRAAALAPPEGELLLLVLRAALLLAGLDALGLALRQAGRLLLAVREHRRALLRTRGSRARASAENARVPRAGRRAAGRRRRAATHRARGGALRVARRDVEDAAGLRVVRAGVAIRSSNGAPQRRRQYRRLKVGSCLALILGLATRTTRHEWREAADPRVCIPPSGGAVNALDALASPGRVVRCDLDEVRALGLQVVRHDVVERERGIVRRRSLAASAFAKGGT
ncbi:uncharacterized protein BcabD6B2_28490 [Babesia caballi]|uniref:Uncharacterized protein n=1 Tax=Babesia caballi TaxID=5871 RepID=A0AAV4LTS9_BABCB|nr:hypothetical protein, conserved [Babesia caballi]